MVKCNLGLQLAMCLDYEGVSYFQVSTCINRFHCMCVVLIFLTTMV